MKRNTKIIIGVSIFIILIIILIIILLKKTLVSDDYYDHINTIGEIETKYKTLGEYKVSYKDYDKYRIYYPSDLSNIYPVILIENPVDIPYTKYEPIFKHLASYGFFVIGSLIDDDLSGKSSIEAIDLLKNKNEDFDNKIDLDSIGIIGYYQGGISAIHASYILNTKAIITISMPTETMINRINLSDYEYDLTRINSPLFMLAGTGKEDSKTFSPFEDMHDNFLKTLTNVMIARRVNIDHSDMIVECDPYITAYMVYYLKDIKEADFFLGHNAEIINNKNYTDVDRKNYYKEDE